MAAFILHWQSRAVVMETLWPAKPKIFTIWPLYRKNLPTYDLETPLRRLAPVTTTCRWAWWALLSGHGRETRGIHTTLMKHVLGKQESILVCNTGDPSSAYELGRLPRVGKGNPLQYSCLENPMDRGNWRATVYRVAKSWT